MSISRRNILTGGAAGLLGIATSIEKTEAGLLLPRESLLTDEPSEVVAKGEMFGLESKMVSRINSTGYTGRLPSRSIPTSLEVSLELTNFQDFGLQQDLYDQNMPEYHQTIGRLEEIPVGEYVFDVTITKRKIR
jgi:hypothetical protein